MITELGHFALILALLTALTQAILPVIGAIRHDARLMLIAPDAALAQGLLILLAFLALTHAHVTDDFSVVNVVEHSHPLKPMLYKIAGVWGNHEGSMLLWALILGGYGAALAKFSPNLPLPFRARALAIQGMIGVGILLFILLTSNPFARLWPPAETGQDLNPLLQDPALALHPPFLYLGYVGFSVAFALALAALIENKVDSVWARVARPWILIAWSFLTVGIALGSWWAYYELGWGGWWFWDPVENASLMPWLAATALLHSVIVLERRGALKGWTTLLAILVFSLSLLGTFLVRSGVLTSVHAFASDPTRGTFVLALLALATGGALTLYAWRAPQLEPGGNFAPLSRESGILFGNLLLVTACATVMIGTLYPLLLDVVGGGAISVGAPYFNATFVPLAMPLAAAAAIGPWLDWRRADMMFVMKKLRLVALAALAVFVLGFALSHGRPVLGLGGFALGVLVIGSSLSELFPLRALRRLPRARLGQIVAHIGLGITILGIAGNSFTTEKTLAMKIGDQVELAGYRAEMTSLKTVEGPNYTAIQAELPLWKGSAFVTTLRPEKRFYQVTRMPTTEAAIATDLLADFYLVLGDKIPPQEDSTSRPELWSIRLYHHPLIPFIWLGALVMAAGGGVSLTGRKRT